MYYCGSCESEIAPGNYCVGCGMCRRHCICRDSSDVNDTYGRKIVRARLEFSQTAMAILEIVMLDSWRRPSITELAEQLDRSRYCIQHHLQRLRKAGLVDWEDGEDRTLVATCRFIPAEELEAA